MNRRTCILSDCVSQNLHFARFWINFHVDTVRPERSALICGARCPAAHHRSTRREHLGSQFFEAEPLAVWSRDSCIVVSHFVRVDVP